MAVHTLGTRPPLIQVGLSVGLTYLSRRLGRPPVLRTALIDTGSVMTAINPTIATALHPLRLGTVDVSRPGGTIRRAPTYDIRLAFEPNPQAPRWWMHGDWFELEAVEATAASPAVDVLIGQDLLDRVVISWDGPRGRLLLMY